MNWAEFSNTMTKRKQTWHESEQEKRKIKRKEKLAKIKSEVADVSAKLKHKKGHNK